MKIGVLILTSTSSHSMPGVGLIGANTYYFQFVFRPMWLATITTSSVPIGSTKPTCHKWRVPTHDIAYTFIFQRRHTPSYICTHMRTCAHIHVNRTAVCNPEAMIVKCQIMISHIFSYAHACTHLQTYAYTCVHVHTHAQNGRLRQ